MNIDVIINLNGGEITDFDWLGNPKHNSLKYNAELANNPQFLFSYQYPDFADIIDYKSRTLTKSEFKATYSSWRAYNREVRLGSERGIYGRNI